MPYQAVDRLVDFLAHHYRLLLVIAAILTVISIEPSRRLSFDESIESLYSSEDVHLKDYVEGKRLFGGDEFAFAVYTDPDLFTDAGQDRARELAERLSKVPGVVEESVQSIPRLLDITMLPIFKAKRQELLDFSKRAILGDDNQTSAVGVRLMESGKSPVTRAETLDRINQIAADQKIKTYVCGEPVLVRDMFRYAQQDGEWMGWAASVLLVLVILFFLRSLRAVILPFVIVQMAIVWTKAILFESRMQLSMVSSILNSLVTIIGVSTVVYMSLFYRNLRKEFDRQTAFRQTVKIIGTDVFWVCLTTAAGFGAQLSSHLQPVRSFGLTMVIGSMLVLVAMFLVLPAGFLMGRERGELPQPRGEQEVNRSLQGLANWVLHHRMLVLTTCGVVFIAFGIGLFKLRIETDFSRNFRSDTPVVEGLNFLEQRLGGSGAWEVNFDAPEDLTKEFLGKVSALAEKLRKIEGDHGPALTKVVAITDGLDLIPSVPLISATIPQKIGWLNRIQPEFVPSLYNAKEKRMRIMLRAYERQSSEAKQKVIDEVGTTGRSAFPEAKVTGLFVLLTFLIQSLLHDQWTDLIWGAVSLITIMTIAYRSLSMGLISLVPNLIPIVLLLGGMGWLSIPVNIGTAMISSDTMGLTIHDSIFYISAYLRARRSGLDFHGALQHVQTETRQPLLYSNIALIIGFLVLATSHFVPLIYFGVMVSVAIAGGLAVNLLLLPLFLQMIDRDKPAG